MQAPRNIPKPITGKKHIPPSSQLDFHKRSRVRSYLTSKCALKVNLQTFKFKGFENENVTYFFLTYRAITHKMIKEAFFSYSQFWFSRIFAFKLSIWHICHFSEFSCCFKFGNVGQSEEKNRLIHFEGPITNQTVITQTDRKFILYTGMSTRIMQPLHCSVKFFIRGNIFLLATTGCTQPQCKVGAPV